MPLSDTLTPRVGGSVRLRDTLSCGPAPPLPPRRQPSAAPLPDRAAQAPRSGSPASRETGPPG